MTHNHCSFLTLRKAIPQFSLFKYFSLFFTHLYPSPSIQPFRTLVIFNPYFFFSFCYIHHTCIEQHPRKYILYFAYLLTPSTAAFLFTSLTANPLLFYAGLFCICMCMDVKEKSSLPLSVPRWCPKNSTPGIFFLSDKKGALWLPRVPFLCYWRRFFWQCIYKILADNYRRFLCGIKTGRAKSWASWAQVVRLWSEVVCCRTRK
jgi:hypothetical protein